MEEYKRRVRSFVVSANRFVYSLRAARSKEGSVGMVTLGTEIGDVFYIVKGMDIPLY
jgi:hypothetical protein